jgi:molecular chaperone DnaK (HSP70)
LGLPWSENASFAVGRFAREHGAKVPDRLVVSAKSWLCHDGVDRTSGLLPFGASDDVEKVSPLEASTRYLKHIAQTWAHARPNDGALRDQQVVLTVPASFDAVARDLTVQAARAAGLERPILLEEPQAALYAWLDAQGEGWRSQLSPGDVVLVCDVGGGTTDFSLIAIEESGGELALRRVAVGDHILLGGDNMDLALAYSVR